MFRPRSLLISDGRINGPLIGGAKLDELGDFGIGGKFARVLDRAHAGLQDRGESDKAFLALLDVGNGLGVGVATGSTAIAVTGWG